MVFLGYGIQVPEAKSDDFAGLDLKGKIAVTIPGSPEGVDGQLQADYERTTLNLDMVHAITPLKEARTIGLEESDLGHAARRASASQGVPSGSETALNPAAFNCCSDQANFIFHGIPALEVKVGFPGQLGAVLEKYRRDSYHKPSDDLHQPVNLDTAAKVEEIVLQLLLDLANDPHRPAWKASSFYKRYAAK